MDISGFGTRLPISRPAPCPAGCICPNCQRKAALTSSATVFTTGQQAPPAQTLSPAERSELEQLKQRDRAVRAHELAHLTASGGLARGGAAFSYQTGPDGKRYAIGGEVSIDTRPGHDPKSTIIIAEKIQAAALAPIDPSGQDRSVARSAASMEQKAYQELRAAQTPQSTDEQSAAQAGPAPQSPQERRLQQAYVPDKEPPPADGLFINTSA